MNRITYESPAMEVELFCPNEFIAACNPPFYAHCNVKPRQGGAGVLFADTNNNGRLDRGDSVVNKINRNNQIGFNPYNPCNATHGISEKPKQKGFLVSAEVFKSARNGWPTYGWFGSVNWPADDNRMRTDFNFSKFGGDPIPVYIWQGDYNDNQKGWHAAVDSGITTNHS